MELNINKESWAPTILEQVVEWYQRDIPNSRQEEEGITAYVTANHIDTDAISLSRFSDLADGQKGPTITKHFEAGDVLLSTRSVALRKAAQAHVSGVTGEKLLVLRPKENSELLAELFPFVFHSTEFWDFALNTAAGSVNKFTSWNKIKNYEFLLPPKDQQAKLAELLWAVNREIQTLMAAEKAARRFRDSIFKAFREKLDKNLSKKVADLLLDGPRNGFSPKTSEEGTSYTVSIGAVKDGRFTPEGNLKKATVDQSTLEKFDVRKNDMFVVRGNGNRLLCGRAGLATETQENLFYPDLLIRLRFDHEQIIPEFAAYQWNHPSAHYRLLQWAKSTNGISKINGADIKNHTLIVPPISEQNEILKEIGKIEKRVEALGEANSTAIRLEKSLINQIF
jgi:type I restriction enzyme S subunit